MAEYNLLGIIPPLLSQKNEAEEMKEYRERQHRGTAAMLRAQSFGATCFECRMAYEAGVNNENFRMTAGGMLNPLGITVDICFKDYLFVTKSITP